MNFVHVLIVEEYSNSLVIFMSLECDLDKKWSFQGGSRFK